MSTMSGMTEQLLPAGPMPYYVAWFFDEDVKEWESVQEVKDAVSVSPIIAWIYAIGADRLPVAVSADEGEIRGPEKLRFYAGSPEEARKNAEVMALSRFRPPTGPRPE